MLMELCNLYEMAFPYSTMVEMIDNLTEGEELKL